MIVKPTHLKRDIVRAIRRIKAGGIVIYPTDTAYAIGCAFRRRSAMQKIMQFKGRVDPKFTVIAASTAQVEQSFKLNRRSRELAQRYWPGPLSLVVSKRFAVRVPDNAIARRLAHACGQPLVATSFNKSGEPPIYSLASAAGKKCVALAKQQLPDIVIIDAGSLPYRTPSTVVEYHGNHITVLRAGPIQPQI